MLIPVSSAVERSALNRVVVGSIPTPGVPPTIPSGLIFYKIESVFNTIGLLIRLLIPVSSAVERSAFNRVVMGSIPIPGDLKQLTIAQLVEQGTVNEIRFWCVCSLTLLRR